MLFRKKPDLRAVLERIAKHGVPHKALEKLARYVREASDRELYQFNPRYFAARLGIDIHAALGLLAYATQEGLFDLNWEVHCPQCQMRLRTFTTLAESRAQEFCGECQVSFDTYLDDHITVTFTLNKAVRKLSVAEPLPADSYPPTLGLELLNVQPFRDLFADQVLPPGESLKVKRVVFLFTDLRGSTAMYAREGDPRAYSWVRDHFDVLFRAANRNHGITVKTIGDAVMASFLTPIDALGAAIDAMQGMTMLNRQLELEGDDALSIRLGAHVGPCISVTLNDKLDYFGATVNIAARVSHLSNGNDIVLTPAMLQDQEMRTKAGKSGRLESFQAELHGYDQHFELQRLVLHERVCSAAQ
jgi:class 3 adenylate cyclase